jgi:molybdenum cofactor cytidylyltransferase
VSEVAAIVLAAGRGTRFGDEPKLLALLDGKPLVRHVAEAAAGASVDPVLVVTGHGAAKIEAALAGLSVQFVPNPRYADGLSTSLKAGFAALPEGARGAVVLLGDMPRVGSSLIDALVEAWMASQPAAVVPVHEGRRGNPVLLSRSLAPEIEGLSGDIGAGLVLRRKSDVLELPVDAQVVLQDVDTPEGLRALGR